MQKYENSVKEMLSRIKNTHQIKYNYVDHVNYWKP